MNSTIGIIPARYLSTRFPGKPLIDIEGKSMICRVYEQCLKASGLDKVYVATDDNRIFNEVTSNGGLAIMTSDDSLNGTLRCFEAYEKIVEKEGSFDFLINIQGDEPFIRPEQITELKNLINTTESPIATLAKVIDDPADLFENSTVKVVLNEKKQAMYFSREAIPFIQGADKSIWLKRKTFYKHIGIYAFKTSCISSIKHLQPTEAEKAESLEQLRWLGNGLSVAVGITEFQTISIDTPSDLERAILYAQSNL